MFRYESSITPSAFKYEFSFLFRNKKNVDISVGVGDNIDPNKRDGVAWCKAKDGIAKVPFVVDKPELLKTNDVRVIKSIFEQLLKIGLLPAYVEVFAGDTRKLYSRTCTDYPIYIDNI